MILFANSVSVGNDSKSYNRSAEFTGQSEGRLDRHSMECIPWPAEGESIAPLQGLLYPAGEGCKGFPVRGAASGTSRESLEVLAWEPFEVLPAEPDIPLVGGPVQSARPEARQNRERKKPVSEANREGTAPEFFLQKAYKPVPLPSLGENLL